MYIKTSIYFDMDNYFILALENFLRFITFYLINILQFYAYIYNILSSKIIITMYSLLPHPPKSLLKCPPPLLFMPFCECEPFYLTRISSIIMDPRGSLSGINMPLNTPLRSITCNLLQPLSIALPGGMSTNETFC